MSVPLSISSSAQSASVSPAQMLNRLVSAQALDAAEILLNDLDEQEFEDCLEEMRALMRDQGIELPDWERLSEQELRKIARGAFYLSDGKVVLMTEA